ncbi:MAG TPA: bifunctional riboflavin kinase/FAD synthetase [Chitinophagaceae bacterium]|nr:bifunctional riboflavin kinase/FAD synthetase [Chitinophagaceae bacterium]
MQVHRDINNLPIFKNAVITVGTFDGVHTGHLQIIKQLKEEAININGESVIITFDPHPRLIIPQPPDQSSEAEKKEIILLNTLNEKIELLEKNGIDHLVVVPFTKQFSELSAEKYIQEFLSGKFHPHTIIIGYDHHFGNERKGNYKLLEAHAEKFNFQVKEIPEHVLNEVTISSTKIRKALLGCDVETAYKFLGYDYFFEGKVVNGEKIGRELGYPTANLELQDKNKLVPGDGIYVVTAIIGQKLDQLKGMMSIGVRPTIDNSKRTIEVNIFDFDKDIYGQTVRVYVKKYLREEKKFSGLEELKAAIAKDKINALEYFLSI